MAFQLSTDLIQQVQIALRNDAGLSTYDPHDPTLPSLPSLGASIAGIDPSTPTYLRCKNCKGKILRGIQSLICIYCGKQLQNKDLPPHPISFTSTFGYQWLLQSLELDESETVELSTEESESNRGQSTPKQEICLGDLLDLQITWLDEPEKPETIVTNKILEQSSSSLNLNGADLDNIFSGSSMDLRTPAEPVIAKQIEGTETKASVGQGNLSFFSSFPSAESAVISSEDNIGNSFSGWAADFQSANKHEGSKSLDPFTGSSVDLSSHMDSVFGSGKDHKAEELEDDSRPSPSLSYDWMQDDLWKNVNSKVSQQAEHFGSTVEAKDSPPHTIKNLSSEGLDWFEDNQWQTNITNAPNTIDEPDDSFDEWNDFTSSTNAQDPSGITWKENAAGDDHTSEINLFSSSNLQENEFGSFSQQNLFSDSPGIQNGSALTNNILRKDPASDRIDNAQSKVEDAPENLEVFITTTQTRQSNDDVEMLMSQMHDLSFMLESNLSVPPKLDGRSSTPKD